VTTLAKDGPGSLRAAVEAKGPRIVVFDVGGVIDFGRSVLTINEPYLTIAGQTAPSPGITLIRTGIDLKGHDVILSHIRVMTGADGQPHYSGWEADALSTVAAHHVLVDHCSFLWALDENMSASGPRFNGKTLADWRANTSHDILFRDNLAAEGLAFASHPKGEHSKGSLIHDNATAITFYRNIFAHNVERSPLVKGGAQVLMINNLIYNPGHRAVHYNLMNLEWTGHPYVTGQITAVGNVMRGGLDTDPGLPFLTLGGDGDLEYYGRDNRAVDQFGVKLPMFGRYGETAARLIEAPSPLARLDGYQILPSGEVETSVLQTAGAVPGTAPRTISASCSSWPKVGAKSSTTSMRWGRAIRTPRKPAPCLIPQPGTSDTMTPKSGVYPGQTALAQEVLSVRDKAMRKP